jgi:hypothetical protein
MSERKDSSKTDDYNPRMKLMWTPTILSPRRWGWWASFVLFGALGAVWAAAWFTWYRDRPEERPSVNAEELAWIQQDETPATAAGVDGYSISRKDCELAVVAAEVSTRHWQSCRPWPRPPVR